MPNNFSLTRFTLVAVTAAAIFAGCSQQSPSTVTPSSSPTSQGLPTETQKTGTTTKSGTIVQLGGKFFLQQPGQQPFQIDSYTVDLKTYLNKAVTITGEYSGDTLFVGSIK